QVTAGLRHLIGPFGAKALDNFVLDGLQLSFFRLAEHGRPARNWAAPYRLALDDRVAIAPGFAYSTPPPPPPARVHASLDQKLKIALMRGARMVPVHAIFHQQLPVRAHTIRLRARDNLHAGLGLVADQIEIWPGARQVVRQAFNGLIETNEDKIPIDLDPG